MDAHALRILSTSEGCACGARGAGCFFGGGEAGGGGAGDPAARTSATLKVGLKSGHDEAVYGLHASGCQPSAREVRISRLEEERERDAPLNPDLLLLWLLLRLLLCASLALLRRIARLHCHTKPACSAG